MTHGELFSGIHGFGLAFERTGFETLWCVELEPSCRLITRRHFPQARILNDIEDDAVYDLPSADVITFGSPCQDLSVAGRRAGMKGERSGLFFRAVDVIRRLRPRFALWENVPGAFSSHGGADFRSVLQSLLDCGARDIAWRVLDARYFGVPQRRRRVFLIADFGGERAGEILFEREGVRRYPAKGKAARQEAAGTLKGSSGKRGWADPSDGNGGGLVAHTLRDSSKRGSDDADRMTFICQTAQTGRNGIGDSDSVAYTLDGSNGQAVARCVTAREGLRNDGESQTFVLYENHGQDSRIKEARVSPALNRKAGTGGNNLPLAESRLAVRRLMPIECERLQGFPDFWTAWGVTEDGGRVDIADSARYRMLGNAVCVPVAEWVARRMRRCL